MIKLIDKGLEMIYTMVVFLGGWWNGRHIEKYKLVFLFYDYLVYGAIRELA